MQLQRVKSVRPPSPPPLADATKRKTLMEFFPLSRHHFSFFFTLSFSSFFHAIIEPHFAAFKSVSWLMQ